MYDFVSGYKCIIMQSHIIIIVIVDVININNKYLYLHTYLQIIEDLLKAGLISLLWTECLFPSLISSPSPSTSLNILKHISYFNIHTILVESMVYFVLNFIAAKHAKVFVSICIHLLFVLFFSVL